MTSNYQRVLIIFMFFLGVSCLKKQDKSKAIEFNLIGFLSDKELEEQFNFTADKTKKLLYYSLDIQNNQYDSISLITSKDSLWYYPKTFSVYYCNLEIGTMGIVDYFEEITQIHIPKGKKRSFLLAHRSEKTVNFFILKYRFNINDTLKASQEVYYQIENNTILGIVDSIDCIK